MSQRRAHLDALGAALAVERLDEDPECGRFESVLGRYLGVLLRADEMRSDAFLGHCWRRLCLGERRDPRLEVALRNGDAEDRAVRARADAGHAADAALGDELR